MYKGIWSEILSTTRFDKNSDLSTTYLGKVNTAKASKIKAEESFLISEQGYTMGKLSIPYPNLYQEHRGFK